MVKREVAWRVLSGELNQVKHMMKSPNSKEPNYALTPLGAMINRVFIIGEAVGMDDFGDDDRSFYRIKLSDPTGITYLAVGQYQPTALRSVRNLQIPSFLAVVGKVKSFEPEGGGLYLSVRPEFIYPATPELRNKWLLSTIYSLKSRLEAVIEAHKMSEPTIDQLKALGYPTSIASGVKNAVEHYGRISIEPFQVLLKDALQFLVEGNGKKTSNEIQSVSPSKMIPSSPGQDSTSTSAEIMSENKNSIEIEKQILKILDSNSSSRKLGMNWNELLMEAKKSKIDKSTAEKAVRELMEKGVVYEPLLGVLKKI